MSTWSEWLWSWIWTPPTIDEQYRDLAKQEFLNKRPYSDCGYQGQRIDQRVPRPYRQLLESLGIYDFHYDCPIVEAQTIHCVARGVHLLIFIGLATDEDIVTALRAGFYVVVADNLIDLTHRLLAFRQKRQLVTPSPSSHTGRRRNSSSVECE